MAPARGGIELGPSGYAFIQKSRIYNSSSRKRFPKSCARRCDPTGHISRRARPHPRAIPRSRLRCGSAGSLAMPPRTLFGPHQTSQQCRIVARRDRSPDKSRNETPTDYMTAAHRNAAGLGRREPRHNESASVPVVHLFAGEGGHGVSNAAGDGTQAGREPFGKAPFFLPNKSKT